MKYTNKLNNDTGICTVCVTGTFKCPNDAARMQQLVCKLYKEEGCKTILFDMRSANIVTNTVKTYDTVSLHAKKYLKLWKVKVAVLYLKLTEDEKFFETVALNRGFSLRAFDNYENSLAWLRIKNDKG